MTDRILITWERHEKYRLALTPEDTADQFGTTDPDKIRSLMLAEPHHADDLQDQHAPDGEGTLSVTTDRATAATEGDEGLFWLVEEKTPGEHRGPFASPDEAFTYWQEHV